MVKNVVVVVNINGCCGKSYFGKKKKKRGSGKNVTCFLKKVFVVKKLVLELNKSRFYGKKILW